MKLGILSSMASTPWGGSEELWVALGNAALENGLKVSVSVFDWKDLPIKTKRLKEKGASIHLRSRISYDDLKGKLKGKLTQLLFAEKQLHGFVSNEKPDVLFVSMGAFCDLEIDSLRTFLLKVKVPFYLVVHSNTETYTVNYNAIKEIQQVCDTAKTVFFVSKRLLQQAERQIAHTFKNSDIAVNPLNVDKTGVVSFPDKGTINMACVGSVQVGVKGQLMLIQLLSSIKWRERKWILNIFGTGPDENIVRKLIEFYDLTDRVFLKGYTNNIRNDVWAQNHILVMPSYIEGMPIALLEAMLCGRTAVVTDVGGNREVLKDGITGFIAEGATPFSFGNKIEEAWQKIDSWEQMGETAYQDGLNYYGEDPIGTLLKKIKGATIS